MSTLLFREDAYARDCAATVITVDERGIQLDRTVFYPAGGGQPGDTGVLRSALGDIPIAGTIKGEGPDAVIHVPAPGARSPAAGEAVTAAIDWDRRHRLMRFHTALHLLCSIVPGGVTGGSIGEDKARLDFDVATDSLDKVAIQARLDALVAAGSPVRPRWIDDEELARRPELVRTMSVKPPSGHGRLRLLDIDGVDLQPCGGTHVRNTAEIGQVVVTKIENKGRQNRRIIIGLA
ncbi:MAG: alanyl-tRNA editing protein [Betaproteobacteria bacterium]|nr:alanyl-tRNA editing protein [Betaproteobacteria bacterium]